MERKILIGTVLSILIFFSISFLTVLFQINSPLNEISNDYYEMEIGFPFVYYREFMVDCPSRNTGWNTKNLILDTGIIWMLTIGVFLFLQNQKSNC